MHLQRCTKVASTAQTRKQRKGARESFDYMVPSAGLNQHRQSCRKVESPAKSY